MTFETSQRYGCFLLVVILIALYAGRDVLTGLHASWKRTHSYSDSRWGTTVVELSGDTEKRGIYYIPTHTPVGRFLEMAGEKNLRGARGEILRRILVSGTTVDLRKAGSGSVVLTTGGMRNARRLALDMPMALNDATLEDLARVDGIGEKTALAIVEKRNEKRGFKSVGDLLEVRGIGSKKLEKFRSYFYVESPR